MGDILLSNYIPSFQCLNYTLDLAYFKNGDYPKALESFEKVKKLYPTKISLNRDLIKAKKVVKKE